MPPLPEGFHWNTESVFGRERPPSRGLSQPSLGLRMVSGVYDVPPWLLSADATWRDTFWWYRSPRRFFRKLWTGSNA